KPRRERIRLLAGRCLARPAGWPRRGRPEPARARPRQRRARLRGGPRLRAFLLAATARRAKPQQRARPVLRRGSRRSARRRGDAAEPRRRGRRGAARPAGLTSYRLHRRAIARPSPRATLQAPPRADAAMKLWFKMVLVGVMTLVILIPLAMV